MGTWRDGRVGYLVGGEEGGRSIVLFMQYPSTCRPLWSVGHATLAVAEPLSIWCLWAMNGSHSDDALA